MSEIVIIPPGNAALLEPTSSAFAHGFGLFETMRYDAGKLYFWDAHWARLGASAQRFDLVLPDEAAVVDALRRLVLEYGLDTATLKLSLLKVADGCRLYVYSRPPIPAPEHRRLRFDASCPLFARSILAGHKTHNYMEAMCLLGLARARGDFDILRLDSEGFLAETTTANLFFVKEGRIHTPALQTGILPGLSRAALLCTRDFEIEEGLYHPETLLDAEAVFVTNATSGVQPIEQIVELPGHKKVDFERDTPLLRAIQDVFTRIQIERAMQLI